MLGEALQKRRLKVGMTQEELGFAQENCKVIFSPCCQ